ncbi:MAG TPA: DinB family protein [Dehalococcoidia bacterium]
MTVVYRAGLSVTATEVNAIVFDLPGCSFSAASVSDARTLLPAAIAEYLSWLASHDEEVAPGDTDAEIVEEVDPNAGDVADGEFCFDDDLRPVTDDEIERAIQLLQRSRGDLVSTIESLPDVLLDWRPPLSAMARVDEWKPGVLTIREIVRDISAAESYYRGALLDGDGPPDPDAELYDLALQRERLIATLRALPASDRGRVFRRTMPWQESGEEHWTVRKVIRRVVGHERFHTAEIRQRLTWVLLGVPTCSRA